MTRDPQANRQVDGRQDVERRPGLRAEIRHAIFDRKDPSPEAAVDNIEALMVPVLQEVAFHKMRSIESRLEERAAIKRAEEAEAAIGRVSELAEIWESFPSRSLRERVIAPTIRMMGADLRAVLDGDQ